MAKQSSSAPVAPSAENIRNHCHGKVWERGRSLAKSRALTGLSRAGNELFGRCAGSYENSYELHARLENGEVTQLSCSCPFEGGGWCKHQVALLLHYSESPDAFRATPSLDEMLGALKRAELQSLIEVLVRAEPKLMKTLAQLYKASRATGANSPADWRANLRDALAGRGAGEGRIMLDLIVKAATQCETKEDWAGASELWCVLLEEIVFAVPHFEEIEDEEPEYGGWDDYHDVEIDTGQEWADAAAAGLERCLDVKTIAPNLREKILKTLWQCYRDALYSDYFGMPEAAFDRVLTEANPALWAEVEAYFVEQLRSERSSLTSADYGREQTLDLLARGLTSRGQAARAHQLLRQYGSYRQQLALRMEERDWEGVEKLALQNDRSYQPEILAVADDLEGAGQHERAERLALHARQPDNPRAFIQAVEWLARFYLRHQNADEAQTQGAALFVKRPDAQSLELWKSAVALGDDWDDWDNRYPRLEKSLDMTPLLRVWLAILDGRAARALELFSLLDKREKSQAEVELARVCASDFPAEAIAIYQRLGEAAVAARSVDNPRTVYQRAAQFWKSAREIHKKSGTMDDWVAYIRAQRETNKRLPALMDELKKAGL